MKTVLFVTNIPSPYRVEFFTLFAKTVKLTVIYERRNAANREKSWLGEAGQKAYEEIFLDGRTFGEENSLSLGLVRHLRKHRYDHVIFGGYNSPSVILAMRWMRRHHRPYGITCDGMLPKEGEVTGWKEKLKRSLISGADFWLSSGHITTRELVRYGANAERVFEFPFSSVREEDIDELPSDRAACKAALGLPDCKLLLYVGQFIPRKGLDVLQKAMELLKESLPQETFRLCLVGGDEKKLEALACSFPKAETVFPGFLNKTQLAAWYRAAELFVLPTREDIWGLVVNEAFAHGLPVVTTERCVAGMEMIEAGRTGVLVPIDDPKALAEGIAAGLKLTDRQAVLEAARAYTLETMAETTGKILERL